MTTKPSRLEVGPADAIRCAVGVLMPCWFITSSFIGGITLLLGRGGQSPMNIGAFVGFGLAACVEALRRVVLYTRPAGGARATRWLRAVLVTLLLTSAPVFLLVMIEGATGCFTGGCADTANLYLSQVFSGVSLLAMPATWTLLTRSEWLRPRPMASGPR